MTASRPEVVRQVFLHSFTKMFEQTFSKYESGKAQVWTWPEGVAEAQPYHSPVRSPKQDKHLVTSILKFVVVPPRGENQ